MITLSPDPFVAVLVAGKMTFRSSFVAGEIAFVAGKGAFVAG